MVFIYYVHSDKNNLDTDDDDDDDDENFMIIIANMFDSIKHLLPSRPSRGFGLDRPFKLFNFTYP